MTRPKYETCRYVETVGQIAVYVKPGCPRSNLIKGHFVTSKRRCEDCRSYRKRVATVNPDFEKAVEEMVRNGKN
ncbi:MAG: hypothetical protein KH828_07775 [Clostridiales bacterium]|nr:hypothetical protein [Clostridiales bacterium]